MIGEILKNIIKKEKLTYRKVAKDLGIDHASLYRSLMNGANPEWKTIEKVLNYLGYEIRIVKKPTKKRGRK
jgi:DNA-binding phage protein